MSHVLGISALFHDAAAALATRGTIVAALQQERLSRKKNDASLPFAAAHACLEIAGIRSADLERVAYYEAPFRRATRSVISCFRNFPRAILQFPAVMSGLPRTLFAPLRIAEGLGVNAERVLTLDHHECHAAAGFYASGFESAAVLVADGVGEQTSTSLWDADARGLRLLRETPFPHSLGLFYAAVTAWLGFEVNEGEYKVMGLAAFGAPVHADVFRRWVQVHEGQVRLERGAFAYESEIRWGYGAAFVASFGAARPSAAAWDLALPADRAFADVAASAQLVLEECMLALAREALARANRKALVVAGGVALNAKAVGILHDARIAERIYVPPGAGDAGGALGAAWLAGRNEHVPRALQSAYLGPTPEPERAHALATQLGLECIPGEAAALTAAAIAAGRLVAVARGALEFGPRALGHCSLLGPAGPVSVRESINRVVKQREPFRPFAPVVRARDLSHYFEGEANECTALMTTVLRARDPLDARLGAVIHVDGSARVQSVTTGFLADVLDALDARGALPVLLNTSLNGPGEPICAGAEDALGFFLAHQVDLLVLGERVYRKPP